MLQIIKKWLHCYFSHPEAVGLLVVLVLGVLTILVLGNILVPIVAGIIIAYLLNGFVKRLVQWKVPHFLAIAIMYLLFVGVFLVLFIWLLPLLFQQLANLVAEIPHMLNRAQAFLVNLQATHPEIFSSAQLHRVVLEFNKYLTGFGRLILSFSLSSIDNLITIVVYVVLVPLLVFFFLKDRKKIAGWFDKFLPRSHPKITKIWQEIDRKTGDYIRGKVIELVLVSIVSIIAFAVMGLHYAILLGACVGISVIVPYVGAVLVTIPVVAIAMLQWGWSAHFAYLILIYAVITVLDANVLVPILYAEALNLHPVVIILAVLIFGGLLGFWGVFFAIPLATFIQALLKGWPRVEKGDANEVL